MRTMSSRQLVSIATAAEYAGVATVTIRRWVSAGLLPAYRYGPRVLRVDLRDLEAMGRRVPTVR